MKTLLMIAIFSTLLTGCPEADPAGNFLGVYQTTLTVGTASYVDSLSITEGQTADLIVTSQNLGAMKATIIGDTSFALDQQQITLTSSTGAFSVTLMGQGTVTGGVLAASGQISGNSGALSLNISGSRQ
jgi:hypothetical protein